MSGCLGGRRGHRWSDLPADLGGVLGVVLLGVRGKLAVAGCNWLFTAKPLVAQNCAPKSPAQTAPAKSHALYTAIYEISLRSTIKISQEAIVGLVPGQHNSGAQKEAGTVCSSLLLLSEHRVGHGMVLPQQIQTTRKKWMFPQTAISYVKDFNCHIGTTIRFWLFGVPGAKILQEFGMNVLFWAAGRMSCT